MVCITKGNLKRPDEGGVFFLIFTVSMSLESFDQFPHSAFARGSRSPAFEGRMWAAMGATEECSAGRPLYRLKK